MISTSGGSLSVLERTRAPGLVATIAAARHLAPNSEETCRASPYLTLPSAFNSNGTARKLVMFNSTPVLGHPQVIVRMLDRHFQLKDGARPQHKVFAKMSGCQLDSLRQPRWI